MFREFAGAGSLVWMTPRSPNLYRHTSCITRQRTCPKVLQDIAALLAAVYRPGL